MDDMCHLLALMKGIVARAPAETKAHKVRYWHVFLVCLCLAVLWFSCVIAAGIATGDGGAVRH